MTHTETRIRAAYQRSGLAFLGIGFERAMTVPAIRIALTCAAKAETMGKPAPVQPALI